MKYLIRFKKEDNSFIDMQTVNEEYNHKYYDVEELPFKEGFSVIYEFNKEQDKILRKYVEILKPPTKQNEEKIKELEDVIYNLQEKLFEISPQTNPLADGEEVSEMSDDEDTKYE